VFWIWIAAVVLFAGAVTVVYHFAEKRGGGSRDATALCDDRERRANNLGCGYDEKGGLACDGDGKTNIPGLYVAGDVSRDVQLAIIAAAEGARAALAVNKYLLDADLRA
jgi:NADPH-dependent glutamate synthase beta subunit-like oxidoreductase